MRIQPALFVLLAAGTGLVTGCRQAPSTAADFNGAWRGDAQFLNSTGRGNSVHEWSIDADPTGRMMVAVTWSMSADDNTHGYDFGGEAVKGDTEQLLGLIDYETGEWRSRPRSPGPCSAASPTAGSACGWPSRARSRSCATLTRTAR